MDIPLIANILSFTNENWGYKTVPNGKCCLSMQNEQCAFHRGKVMGGSSTINYMASTRGNRRNYDRWEEMGNPGWGYKGVLPYFLKCENMTIPELADNTKYHSTSGELSISYAPYRSPMAEAYLQAGAQLGCRVIDYNGKHKLVSVIYNQQQKWNPNEHIKSISASDQISQYLSRDKNSLVTKLLIHPYNKPRMEFSLFVTTRHTKFVPEKK